MYVILSFVGDYPVEGQPYWNEQYDKKEVAIRHAKVQHNIMVPDHEGLYTIVIEKENDEVVEYIKYKNLEIRDKIKASKLADELFTEGE